MTDGLGQQSIIRGQGRIKEGAYARMERVHGREEVASRYSICVLAALRIARLGRGGSGMRDVSSSSASNDIRGRLMSRSISVVE